MTKVYFHLDEAYAGVLVVLALFLILAVPSKRTISAQARHQRDRRWRRTGSVCVLMALAVFRPFSASL